MIRSEWFATVKDVPEGIRLVSLVIGGQIILEEPEATEVKTAPKKIKWVEPKPEPASTSAPAPPPRYEYSEPSDVRVFKFHLARAIGGDDFSQFETGMNYLIGKGVSVDTNNALEWLAKSAAQGHPSAKKQLEKMGN